MGGGNGFNPDNGMSYAGERSDLSVDLALTSSIIIWK